MRKYLALLAVIFVVSFGCDNDSENITPETFLEPEPRLLSREQLDNMIISSLQEKDEFRWSQASDEELFSALMLGDSILTIGYRPTSEENIARKMAYIDVEDEVWQKARLDILKTIKDKGENSGKSLRSADLNLFEHAVLPFIEIKISDFEIIKSIRQLPNVRYAEPLGYEVNFRSAGTNNREESDSGCSNDPENGLSLDDYMVISPNAKVSWNYSFMNIPQAWNYATGQGITVGLIDTGISAGQAKLNSQFNSGYSSGRYVNKYGFYNSSFWPWDTDPDGPDDQCGHGTAMAGVMAAPRSNSGSSVGVAYNANLVAVRGTGDVLVNSGKEKTGVSDALVFLGDRTGVKIISMSIGDVFTNSKVEDAIRYAYGKGKLIFAAAGTSTSFTNWYGVIFPASMSETVAVTGIKEGQYERCDVCHSGPKVDFTIVMEKASNDRHGLTLAMSGDQPSTVGGSSVATATAAGIAALVWSNHPNWNRDQVLNKLKETADLYPNRNSEYGWGTIDALAAVN
ncbi:S8 family peptidase [Fulvivirga sediminis]|uniref:S8 family serine peptidase n=1 Tax=Fulvivirga sediminis TaxID=2803949 RepID=A0A937FA43_9BACT|nr:S8 family serine peptidase [Fulvivirga sediminis]MBL3657787.1 S8 family serine peptidase [Fulvivirga sediminis]